jgi:tetratricopeptide (TPR) repeat protein
MKRLGFFLLFWGLSTFLSNGQPNTHIRTYKKTIKSYLFSDPNPIPSYSNIYPYFRFDGFTDKPVDKQWIAIDLENPYIKLTVLPEIGGRIWSAVEKSTGRPFLYENHVVKFRDIALRGPWLSGGLEANYGIFGHTPNTATPVDYLTWENKDGSVSCFISVLDLLTQTTWTMEINLQKDKAYFTTRSFWYNANEMEVPNYHWMNAAVKTTGNLEFIFPGTHYIGHSGEFSDWPLNLQKGKNISFYDQNNFGGYKSYHVLGRNTDFFGAYWHKEDYGMARYAPRDEKAGKKIWIWGQSGQGMIWEKLLTDTDGQYAEIQSGRLFNQTEVTSSYTPFKHLSLAAAASDVWTEYWFPVLKTGGFVEANSYGAINVSRRGAWLNLKFSPVQQIDDVLSIQQGGSLVYEKKIRLQPLQLFVDSIKLEKSGDFILRLGQNKIVYRSDTTAGNLSRPLSSPKDFDWNTAYGLYVQGKELMGHKLYDLAENKLRASLNKEPYILPALVQLAAIRYHKMEFSAALELLKTALSVNTYDAAANYYYGLVNVALKHNDDAKDGFEVASLLPAFRAAAFNGLASLYLKEKDNGKAISYAQKALQSNPSNITALQIKAVAFRNIKNRKAADSVLSSILNLNPLNHFARFEKYLWSKSSSDKVSFQSLIRNEQPVESYLDLADKYEQTGCIEESITALELAPANALVYLKRAYLKQQIKLDFHLDMLLAEQSTAAFVFPFRSSDEAVLLWATRESKDWKPKYFLALLYKDRNRIADYEKAFISCGDVPDFAPFYGARAGIHLPSSELADLKRAVQLDPNGWRYQKLLAEYYINHRAYQNALAVIKPFCEKHPENYLTGLIYANTLLLDKQYSASLNVLSSQKILPFEGATTGRRIYRQALLNLALQELRNKRYAKCIQYIERSRAWPEHLGAGKPFQENVDERLEDWLTYLCLRECGKSANARAYLKKIIAFQPATENGVRNFLQANSLLSAWAIALLQDRPSAEKWLNAQLQLYPQDEILLWAKEKFQQQRLDKQYTTASEISVLEQLLGFE